MATAPVTVFQPRKVYVASSWRNDIQPNAVSLLRALGHEVYDFRNPRPGDHGFAWSEIDPDWLGWSPPAFRDLLSHPIAASGFKSDFDAMTWADTFVLVLPCGRSAHLEAGWAIGAGKPTCLVLHEDKFEPELMYLMADRVACDLDEMRDWIDGLRPVGLTHGRHCSCGMHGSACPDVYAPIVGRSPIGSPPHVSGSELPDPSPVSLSVQERTGRGGERAGCADVSRSDVHLQQAPKYAGEIGQPGSLTSVRAIHNPSDRAKTSRCPHPDSAPGVPVCEVIGDRQAKEVGDGQSPSCEGSAGDSSCE